MKCIFVRKKNHTRRLTEATICIMKMTHYEIKRQRKKEQTYDIRNMLSGILRLLVWDCMYGT